MRFVILAALVISSLVLLINQEELSTYSKISELNCGDCNLILIMAHGLRPDHLSSFGYFRQTSQNIDKIVADGLTFDSLISTSVGLEENQKKILSYPSGDLTSALKSNNYTTSAFFDGRRVFEWLKPYPFDTFDNSEVPLIKEKLGNVSKFLKENKNSKFFMLVSSFEIHHPHRYPSSFYKKYDPDYSGVAENVSMLHHWHRLENGSYMRLIDLAHIMANHTEDINDTQVLNLDERDKGNIIARYDEAIYHFDEFIGSLLLELKANDLEEKTVFVITSDVGLQLFERGAFTHERAYDETTKLMLSIYRPGLEIGERASTQIVHEDIAPALMKILGFNVTDNLIDLVDGKINSGHQFVAGKSDDVLLNCKFVRTSEWKLIECDDALTKTIDNIAELYNLKDDPDERINLIAKQKRIYKELKQKLGG